MLDCYTSMAVYMPTFNFGHDNGNNIHKLRQNLSALKKADLMTTCTYF